MEDDSARITLTISEASVSRLRALARLYGFVTTAGRMSGQGNVSGLIEAIGRGDLTILLPDEVASEYQRLVSDSKGVLSMANAEYARLKKVHAEMQEMLAKAEATIARMDQQLEEGDKLLEEVSKCTTP